MRTIYILLFLISFTQVKAQDNQGIIDSLRTEVSDPKCSDSLRAKLLYNMAWYSNQLIKPAQTIAFARQSLEISSELNLDTIIYNSAKILSIIYVQQSQFDSAFTAANSGIAYFDRKTPSRVGLNIAPLYMLAGNALTYLNKHSEALLFHKQARLLFEQQKDTTGYIMLAISQGQLYTSLSLYEDAFKSFYYAMGLAKKYQPETLPSLYNNLSITYGKIGDIKKAKEGFEECIYWARKTKDKQSLANAYNNLAIRLAQDMPDSAFYYYAMAQRTFETIKQSKNKKRVILNVCQLHIDLEHYETARNKLYTLQEIPDDMKTQYFHTMANLAHVDKQLTESLQYAYKGLEFAYLDNRKIEELYLLIYTLNKTYVGNNEAALDAYEHYVEIVQENWDKEEILATQKALVENGMQDNKKEGEGSEKNLVASIETKQNALWVWILTIFICFGLVLMIWYLSKKRTTVLDSKNKTLEKEITQWSLEASKNATFLDALKKELKQTKDLSNSDISRQVNSMLISVEQYTRSDNERKIFQEKVKNIPPSFFAALNKNAKLTPTELKLATLLKLELSSKEIAIIMNISEKSVETYRSKLRKKLEIDKNTSLGSHFSSI